MKEIDGHWTMCGLTRDDPRCIRTVEEAKTYIEEVGFLPFFQNEIPGFSLEDRTVSEDWWGEDASKDPWAWRTVIAADREIAYGKFFGGRAGFISRKWIPYFANYRRDGYDFDALYEDGKASMRQKKIMDFFMEEAEDAEWMSNELKAAAGFCKGGEKGYESCITNLSMMLYLCNCEFRRRKNKQGKEYGWEVAVYSTPEHIWGYSHVTSQYRNKPADSWEEIVKQVQKVCPEATLQQIKKALK